MHDHAAYPMGMGHDGEHRSVAGAMLRGASNRCPACGKAPLFSRLMEIHPTCLACATPLHHHRADDLPIYLNIFVVGHVVVGIMMSVMLLDLLSLWPLTFLAAGLSVVSAFALMRPLKGGVIGAQWALRMHGFGDERSD